MTTTETSTTNTIVSGECAQVEEPELEGSMSIPLNLPNEVLFRLMCEAHKQDITFNQFMINALIETAEQVLATRNPV